eukprot:Pgem_evm1s2723
MGNRAKVSARAAAQCFKYQNRQCGMWMDDTNANTNTKTETGILTNTNFYNNNVNSNINNK